MTARAGDVPRPGRRRAAVPWGGLIAAMLALAATAGCERRPSQPQPPRVGAEVTPPAPVTAPAGTVVPAASPAAPAASQIAR